MGNLRFVASVWRGDGAGAYFVTLKSKPPPPPPPTFVTPPVSSSVPVALKGLMGVGHRPRRNSGVKKEAYAPAAVAACIGGWCLAPPPAVAMATKNGTRCWYQRIAASRFIGIAPGAIGGCDSGSGSGGGSDGAPKQLAFTSARVSHVRLLSAFTCQ